MDIRFSGSVQIQSQADFVSFVFRSIVAQRHGAFLLTRSGRGWNLHVPSDALPPRKALNVGVHCLQRLSLE